MNYNTGPYNVGLYNIGLGSVTPPTGAAAFYVLVPAQQSILVPATSNGSAL